MKILLFLVLVVNFILFFWEYNATVLNSSNVKNTSNNNNIDDISLVNELRGSVKSDSSLPAIAVNTISDKENYEIDRLLKENSNLVIANNYDNKSSQKVKQDLVKSNAVKNQIEARKLNKEVAKNNKKSALVVVKKEGLDNSLLMSKLNLLDNMISKSKKFEVGLQEKQTSENVVVDKKLKPVVYSKQKKVNSSEVPGKSTVPDNKVLVAKKVKTLHVNSLRKEKTAKILQPLCYQIGPFKNKTAVDVWRKQNKIDAAASKLITKKVSKVKSYLVYYPAGKNFRESKKNVQILKRIGITDYWLFRKGSLKGAISLGMFTKDSRALRFKEKLANKGLDVKIKKNLQTKNKLYSQIVTNNKKFKDTVVVSKKQALSKCEGQK